MKKLITISKQHSSRIKDENEKLILELEGGSPWFTYLWIDDVMYLVTKSSRQVNIKKYRDRKF